MSVLFCAIGNRPSRYSACDSFDNTRIFSWLRIISSRYSAILATWMTSQLRRAKRGSHGWELGNYPSLEIWRRLFGLLPVCLRNANNVGNVHNIEEFTACTTKTISISLPNYVSSRLFLVNRRAESQLQPIYHTETRNVLQAHLRTIASALQNTGGHQHQAWWHLLVSWYCYPATQWI